MAPVHILLVAMSAWGHTRPLCVLAARLVSQRDDQDVLVTMFCPPNVLDKIRPEISRQLPTGTADKFLERIRIVCLFKSDERDLFALLGPFAQSYPAAYQSLVDEQPVTCAGTGTVFAKAPAPILVIIDFFCFPMYPATRQVTGKSVPILVWATGAASTLLKIIGPVEMGGPGHLMERLTAEAAKQGKTIEEVAGPIIEPVHGSLINVPGLPLMYDYEYYPQQLPMSPPILAVIQGTSMAIDVADGVLHASSFAYEPASLEAMRQWLNGIGKKVYAIGPLLPARNNEKTAAVQLDQSFPARDLVFKQFLDDKLNSAEFGKNSVIFISFGTFFWPAATEYVDEVIGAFIEKRFPFIFCTASPITKLPPGLEEKIKSSGIGMLTTWSPQQYILDHPATGWFLSHCGHGGITESLGSGVPLIAWPFAADQPSGAAHLTTNLKAAFELIQVRSGEQGLKPLHPSRGYPTPSGTVEAVAKEIQQIIDQARGAEGEERRRNAQKIQREFRDAWEKDGVAARELQAMIDNFVIKK